MDQPSFVPDQVRRFAPKPKPKPREDDRTAETERALIAMLHAAGASSQNHERAAPFAEQPSRALPAAKPQGPAPREDDLIDKAGTALIAMMQKAAGVKDEEYEQATILAGQLAGKLGTNEQRINELEAEIAHFRDRAARAEEWLQLISREIESRLLVPQGAARARGAGD